MEVDKTDLVLDLLVSVMLYLSFVVLQRGFAGAPRGLNTDGGKGNVRAPR